MGFASAEDNKIEMEGELFVSMEITGRDPSGGTAELTPFILNNGEKIRLIFQKGCEVVNVKSMSIFDNGTPMKVRGINKGDSIFVHYIEYLTKK